MQVQVPDAGERETTSTRDISARGICFFLATPIRTGAELECVLTLPEEICQGASIRVRCLGRVLRVERPAPGGRTGIAATIEKYEFLRASEA